jgi:hypothetical protein
MVLKYGDGQNKLKYQNVKNQNKFKIQKYGKGDSIGSKVQQIEVTKCSKIADIRKNAKIY